MTTSAHQRAYRWAPAAVLLVGLLASFWPTLASGFATVQGGSLDSRLNNLLLEHSWLWASTGGAHPLWDAPFFFPARNTFAYSDVLLSSAPLYWMVRGLGVPADASFQTYTLLCSALNFAAMVLLLRSFPRLSWLAIAGGAFLFAFGAPRMAQIGRPQLLVHFWTPLALWALLRWWSVAAPGAPEPGRRLRTVRLGWAALFGFGVAAQVYGSFYLGWFLAFGLAVLAAVALLHAERRRELLARVRAALPSIAASAAIAALTLAPLAAHYLAVEGELGARPYWHAVNGLARPATWIDLGERSYLWGWLMEASVFEALPLEHEHTAGIGFVTIGVVLAGAFRLRRRPWGPPLAIATLLLVAAVTFVHPSASPWRAVHLVVPGAHAIRTPARIVLLLLVPASLWLACALDAAERRRPALAALLLVLLVAEQARSTESYDRERYRARAEAIADAVSPDCRAFFYSVHRDVPTPPDVTWATNADRQLDAAWAALESGVPTVNGYSGNVPPGWDLRDNVVWADESPGALTSALEAWSALHGLEGLCRVVTGPGGTEARPAVDVGG